MQKITPFLWFDNDLEEALDFYTAIFDNSEVLNVVRNGNNGPGPEGAVFTATFQLEGQKFMGLNGGPMFKFTEAISFFVSCKTQEEIDNYWYKLIADGGKESMCGWLKDKYGVSWQIIPENLGSLLWNEDPAKSGKAMQAMLKMHKLDIAALEAAAA